MPAGKIVKTGGIEKVIEYCQGLGDGYINKLSDMFVFDYLIMNSDRHYGNFGFLFDNSTNCITVNVPQVGEMNFNFTATMAILA